MKIENFFSFIKLNAEKLMVHNIMVYVLWYKVFFPDLLLLKLIYNEFPLHSILIFVINVLNILLQLLLLK